MLHFMRIDRDKLLARARTAVRESGTLDFKRGFDQTSAAALCELVKDIVAFANSGGGVVVFGVDDDGSPANFDSKQLLTYDASNFTTCVAKYTGHQFGEVELVDRI